VRITSLAVFAIVDGTMRELCWMEECRLGREATNCIMNVRAARMLPFRRYLMFRKAQKVMETMGEEHTGSFHEEQMFLETHRLMTTQPSS
jgi:hypothetical protein